MGKAVWFSDSGVCLVWKAFSIILLIVSLGKAAEEPLKITVPRSPYAIVVMADKDLLTVPKESWDHIRYLSLHHLPALHLAEARIVIQTQFNFLSRSPKLYPLYVVPDSGGRLLRVNLAEYRINPNVWEQFKNVEYIFRFKIARDVIITKKSKRRRRRLNGTRRPAKKVKIVHKKVSFEFTSWPDKDKKETDRELINLISNTGSVVPVVSGTWFFYRTVIQTDRDEFNPGYDQFLGVKNQADFEKLIGFSKDFSEDRTKPLRMVVTKSGVAIQPRRLQREGAIEGAYWRSFDNKLATDQNNPKRVLNGTFKFDATEALGHLANGLWAAGLWDNKGNFQASAPDFVGHDKTTTSNDGRIHKPLGCIRCHSDGGLQDVDDDIRRKFKTDPQKVAKLFRENLPVLALSSPDPNEFLKLQELYLRPTEPDFQRDRQRHNDAIAEITGGWTSRRFASRYAVSWKEWAEDQVPLEMAAAELGIEPRKFQQLLHDNLKRTGYVDSVLSDYLEPRDEQKGIPRDLWIEAYSLAQFVVRGEVPQEFIIPKQDGLLRELEK